MRNEILTLTKLECRNLLGLNTFRYSKDKKQRNRFVLLSCVWLVLLFFVVFYVVSLVFGLVQLGFENVVVSYLTLLVSFVIFLFNLFMAHRIIFSADGYDLLCSLPVSKKAIVGSRFLHLYIENVLLTLVVMIPGSLAYALFTDLSIVQYVCWLFCMIWIPLVPLVVSGVIGTLITTIAVRMKHRALVETILSIIALILLFSSFLSVEKLPAEFTIEMFMSMATVISEMIGKLYPLAIWVEKAVVYGDVLYFLLFMVASMVSMGLFVLLVSGQYHKICQRLLASSATHDYKMEKVKQKSVMYALYKREWTRYFASSIYVTNTLVGPIMGVIGVISLMVVDVHTVLGSLPFSIDVVGLLPYLVAAIFCMMPMTAVSISMEGKHIWILKSFPVSTKQLLDSKMVFNASLLLPFYLLVEVLLFLLFPIKGWALLERILSPILFIAFAIIFGITIDLRFHNFDWTKEETVVKQSAAAMIGGFGATLLTFGCIAFLFFVQKEFYIMAKVVINGMIAVLACVLYQHNYQKDIETW